MYRGEPASKQPDNRTFLTEWRGLAGRDELERFPLVGSNRSPTYQVRFLINNEKYLLNRNEGFSLPIERECQLAIESLISHGYPTIKQAAGYMGSSVRTLQRRLHAAGVTYSSLVEQVLHDLACKKLETTHQHVGEVAKDLGFRDHSSFSRAFQRWTGMSPCAYRQSLHATDEPGEGKLPRN